LVYDAQGKAVAAAELPKVSLVLRTKGDGRPRVALVWVGPHACLEGRAQLEAGLVAEPIEVTLEGAAQARATLSDYAILPFARFGGSVLAVGPYAVELVVQPDVVLAYVLDASGKAQGGAELALQLQVGAGAGTPLALEWDPARARYTAPLDAKLDVSSEPLRLGLTASGKAYLGAVQSLKALAAARLDVRAQLEAPKLEATLTAGAPAPAGANLKLNASAQARTAALSKAKVSASTKRSAPSLTVKKSASAGVRTTSSKAKASAGLKASASFGFGR
jgi:hypothetical protein